MSEPPPGAPAGDSEAASSRTLALRCRSLLAGARWAALATTGEEGPLASMVAYALEPGLEGMLLHLSTLAPHTANVLARPQASLVVSEPDPGGGDPQTLARAAVMGPVALLSPGTSAHEAARARYLARLPDAEPRFGFGDFRLFRLTVAQVHFVGGFAAARRWDGAAFARLAAP